MTTVPSRSRYRHTLTINLRGDQNTTKKLKSSSRKSNNANVDEEAISQHQASKTVHNIGYSLCLPITNARPSRSLRAVEILDSSSNLTDKDNFRPAICQENEIQPAANLQGHAELGVGAEAPHKHLDDTTDAADNVEFPEAVVLVGQTQWRCISCKANFARFTSIDEHVNIHHAQQTPLCATLQTQKRGQGRGRGLARGKIPIYSLKESLPEIIQKPLKSSLRPVRVQSIISGQRGSSECGKPRLRGRGKRWRGSGGGRGGKNRGGKGRVFTKPLTSDSDTELDIPAEGPMPSKASPKRKTKMSSEMDADIISDRSSLLSNKKPRSREDKLNPPDRTPVKILPSLPEPTSPATSKDLLKEKYMVIIEKAGNSDCPSQQDIHTDNDPPLPIETPSLQADAFLPPATPILPDIHGPPETPILPDTPHLLETSIHTDPFQLQETHNLVDSQEMTHSHEFVLPEARNILSVITTGNLAKSENRTCAEARPVAGESQIDKPIDPDTVSSSLCQTCGAAFDSLIELKSHREEMVKFDVVSCKDCGDKFHGLHQLNVHVFTTHEKFARKFCFLCDADCLDGFELEEHLLEHTSNETDPEDDVNDLYSTQQVCKTCREELEGNLSDLVNHYQTIHNQLFCMKCHEIFADLTEFEDHKLGHMSDTYDIDAPVVYTCPVSDCFQMCSDKESLMGHISWHEDCDFDEERLNMQQCHHCSSQFRNKTSLQRHLAEMHNEPDLKPFVCELCGEDFSHSLELHRHNTIHHTGIKRYGCAYCNQRFAFRSSHRRHVAFEHDVAATVLRM